MRGFCGAQLWETTGMVDVSGGRVWGVDRSLQLSQLNCAQITPGKGGPEVLLSSVGLTVCEEEPGSGSQETFRHLIIK